MKNPNKKPHSNPLVQSEIDHKAGVGDNPYARNGSKYRLYEAQIEKYRTLDYQNLWRKAHARANS